MQKLGLLHTSHYLIQYQKQKSHRFGWWHWNRNLSVTPVLIYNTKVIIATGWTENKSFKLFFY